MSHIGEVEYPGSAEGIAPGELYCCSGAVSAQAILILPSGIESFDELT